MLDGARVACSIAAVLAGAGMARHMMRRCRRPAGWLGNRRWPGEIQRATVSRLPFPDDRFDLVTAVETHYYWPNLPGDVREIRRVLKQGGWLLILAEVYRHSGTGSLDLAMNLGGGVLSPDDHRDFIPKGRLFGR